MARVRLNRAQIDLVARTRGQRLVQDVVNETERGARALVPVGDHMSGSGKRHRGPALSTTIYSRITANSRSVVGQVGAKANHAATVHQGSSAHTIRSSRGKMLKFRWERGDFLVAARAGRRRGNRRTRQFFYFMSVRHPGNKRPVRYLTTPLSFAARKHGFVVLGVGMGRRRFP